MVEQDMQAMGTVRVRAPFVYRFLGRNRADHRPRHRFAIDHIEVELPSIDRLPHPQYITHPHDEDESDWSAWYDIGGVLMRRVVEDGLPTTLGQIERARLLVMPPKSEIEFFDDHPSAIYRIHNRSPQPIHYLPVPDVAAYVVLDSDRDRSAEAAWRNFERCVEHIGTLMAPAPPPTWRVRLAHGYIYLEVSSSRLPPLRRQFPAFHFPIHHQRQARAFAELLVERAQEVVRLEVQDVEWLFADDAVHALGGSLDTARAFAYHFCRRLMNRKLRALSRGEVDIHISIRKLFEEFGTEEEADVALARVENMDLSGMGTAIVGWQAMLKLRRQLLNGPSDCAPGTPPSAEDLDILGRLSL